MRDDTKNGCVSDYNLGQNKVEQQTLIPPPPLKSRMKPREGQKSAIFPSLIWGEGEGGGGSRFSIYFVQDCSSMQVRSLPVPLRYKVFPA